MTDIVTRLAHSEQMQDDGLVDLQQDAIAEIERLREVIDHLVTADDRYRGRYVIWCDDGSVIATDELMDGDDVLIDRGAA